MVSACSHPCNFRVLLIRYHCLQLLVKSYFNFYQGSIMSTIFLVLKWVLIMLLSWDGHCKKVQWPCHGSIQDHSVWYYKAILIIIRPIIPFWSQNIFFWVENLKHHNLYLVINNNLIDYYQYRLIKEIESNSCHKIVVYETFFLDGSCVTEFFFQNCV